MPSMEVLQRNTFAQALFLILAMFSLLHAIYESRNAEFRRLKLKLGCMLSLAVRPGQELGGCISDLLSFAAGFLL